MATLYRICIRCPLTGELLETGIQFTSREALNGGTLRDACVPCRHCGQSHSFSGNGSVQVQQVPGIEGLWRPNP